MKPESASFETLSQTEKQGEPETGSTLLNDVWELSQQLRGLGHDHFLLAALETKRAGESFVTMLVAGIMLAALLFCSWLGLLAAAVLELIRNGMVASSAILLAVAVNLLLMLIVCVVMRRKSYYLQFPAILRALQPKQRNTE